MATWKFAVTVVTRLGAFAIYTNGEPGTSLEDIQRAYAMTKDGDLGASVLSGGFRLVAVSDRPEALPEELEESVLDAYSVGNGGGPVQVEERLHGYHVRFAGNTVDEVMDLKARHCAKKDGAD